MCVRIVNEFLGGYSLFLLYIYIYNIQLFNGSNLHFSTFVQCCFITHVVCHIVSRIKLCFFYDVWHTL